MSSDQSCIDRFSSIWERGLRAAVSHANTSPFNVLKEHHDLLTDPAEVENILSLNAMHTPRPVKIAFGRQRPSLVEIEALKNHPDCAVRSWHKQWVAVYHGSGVPVPSESPLVRLFANYVGFTAAKVGPRGRLSNHERAARPGSTLEPNKNWYKQMRDVTCPREPTFIFLFKAPRALNIRPAVLEIIESVWMHLTGYIMPTVITGLWDHLDGYKAFDFQQDFLPGNNSYSVCSGFRHHSPRFSPVNPGVKLVTLRLRRNSQFERRCRNGNCKIVVPNDSMYFARDEDGEAVGFHCMACHMHLKRHKQLPTLAECVRRFTISETHCSNCSEAFTGSKNSSGVQRYFCLQRMRWLCSICWKWLQRKGEMRPIGFKRGLLKGPCSACHRTETSGIWQTRKDGRDGVVCNACTTRYRLNGTYEFKKRRTS